LRNPYKSLSKVNPQPGPDHREIERSVFHALIAAGLPGPEYQVVLFIIDMTWGWHKTEDSIGLSQFMEATHLDRRYLFRVIDSLEKRQMIIVQRTKTGGRGKMESLNSDGQSPFRESATDSHCLPSNSDTESPIINSDSQSPFMPGKSDESAGKSDSHAQGKSDSQSPTIGTSIDNPSIDIDILLAEISKLYSENIGFIKPALADELREFCGRFTGPVSWVKPAFKEAIKRNKKSWHYVSTILEDWEEKGGPDDGDGRRNDRVKSTNNAARSRGTRGHTAQELRDSLGSDKR